MHKKVIDENGVVYNSLYSALRSTGRASVAKNEYERLYREGKITIRGKEFKLAHYEQKPEEPLYKRLKERYSREELEMIARGEGLKKTFIPFPQIRLGGEHHRILVMSDTHIGSVYAPYEWHDIVSEYANNPKNGIECILHLGDLTEGMKTARIGTQIYELSDIGFEAQKERAIELMGKYKKPIYVISGNHDAFYKENAGVDIVKEISDALPNMTYIGFNSADIKICGTTIRMFHGGDGSSYALSYRLQKLVEGINGGNKPNILLAGHTHKFCYVFERNIHAISVPAMQSQTAWMQGKRLAAHTGFLVLDFEVNDGISNLSVKYYPFYA